MAVPPPAGMSYVIDRSDTIIEVGPTWSEFAQDNGSLITHGICPSCADAIDRELRSAG